VLAPVGAEVAFAVVVAGAVAGLVAAAVVVAALVVAVKRAHWKVKPKMVHSARFSSCSNGLAIAAEARAKRIDAVENFIFIMLGLEGS